MTDDLVALVARLRAECAWDRAQDLGSMRGFVLEESHELLAAIDEGSLDRVREELGDLLFQVVLLARILEESGGGGLGEVEKGIIAKLVERHPHLFGAAGGGTLAEWEAAKVARRGGSRLDGVPATLPALLRAHRVAEKAAAVGFDWPDLDGVVGKVDEERAELGEALARGDLPHARQEYGDLLLAMANLGRFLGVAGEDALREANAKFERRFRGVEALAAEARTPLEEAGMERLEGWWQETKRREVP